MVIAQSGHEKNGILIGMTLGDSYLRKRNEKTYMETVHAARYSDYLIWKRDILKNYLGGDISYKSQERKGKVHDVIRWYVSVTEKLNYLYDWFYIDGVKSITPNILNRCTIGSLAIWYMDDGHLEYGRHKRISLSTRCFSIEENNLIREWFYYRLGIHFNLTSQNDLRANWKESQKFLKVVGCLVSQVPSMRYKLPEGFDYPVFERPFRGYCWQRTNDGKIVQSVN